MDCLILVEEVFVCCRFWSKKRSCVVDFGGRIVQVLSIFGGAFGRWK